MAVIKCKMCGGSLNVTEDSSVCECEYCGTKQTVPKADDEKKLKLFDRAGKLLRSCEFDKASGVFETILADFPEEAEAYWGLVLCKYGIEYVDDPATGKKVPTCHRSSFDNVLKDPNYEQACENTDAVARRVYRDEARAIEELRRGILDVSGKEEPYDVFLSYKEKDGSGERTPDSVIAQDIYRELTREGYRVFFSRISLEGKLGVEYEPYIFAALNSARVMIVVGTDYEHFDAVWVKNEWSRYLKLIAKGEKKTLIPVFRDMDAYDMPEEFSKLTALDMGRLGAMQDLVHGVEKIIGKKQTEAQPQPAQQVIQQIVQGGGPNVDALLKRGQQALEDSDWDSARGFYDQVLSMDAENAEAFLGLALAGSRSRDPEAYVKRLCVKSTSTQERTIEQDQRHIEAQLDKLAVPGYLGRDALARLYPFEEKYRVLAPGQKAAADAARQQFDADRSLSRAFRYAKGETKEKLEGMRASLEAGLARLVKEAEQADQAEERAAREAYAAATKQADEAAESRNRAAQEKREADYRAACAAYRNASSSAQYKNAAGALAALMGYRDSAEKEREARQKSVEQEKAEQEAKEKAEAAAAKKRKKLAIIIASTVAAVAVLALAALLIVTKVIIPARIEREKAAAYAEAEALLEAGETRQAALTFGKAGDYRDAPERSRELWDAVAVRDVVSAGGNHTVGLRADGTVLAVGRNNDGQCEVSDWTDVVAVAAGGNHTVGLRADGTVLAVWIMEGGQREVSDWRDIVAVAAGADHTVGLRADGTVVAAGWNADDRCTVSGWTDVVAISAGRYHTVGLRADGTVVAAGYNGHRQCDVFGWTDIVAVSAGELHTVGLKADGTVVAVGGNSYSHGQCDVSDWTDIVAISAGERHTVGLRADGTVVAVGDNGSGQCEVSGWTDIVAISAGRYHTVGLKADGTVLAVGINGYGQCNVSNWTDIKVPEK